MKRARSAPNSLIQKLDQHDDPFRRAELRFRAIYNRVAAARTSQWRSCELIELFEAIYEDALAEGVYSPANIEKYRAIGERFRSWSIEVSEDLWVKGNRLNIPAVNRIRFHEKYRPMEEVAADNLPTSSRIAEGPVESSAYETQSDASSRLVARESLERIFELISSLNRTSIELFEHDPIAGDIFRYGKINYLYSLRTGVELEDFIRSVAQPLICESAFRVRRLASLRVKYTKKLGAKRERITTDQLTDTCDSCLNPVSPGRKRKRGDARFCSDSCRAKFANK